MRILKEGRKWEGKFLVSGQKRRGFSEKEENGKLGGAGRATGVAVSKY